LQWAISSTFDRHELAYGLGFEFADVAVEETVEFVGRFAGDDIRCRVMVWLGAVPDMVEFPRTPGIEPDAAGAGVRPGAKLGILNCTGRGGSCRSRFRRRVFWIEAIRVLNYERRVPGVHDRREVLKTNRQPWFASVG